MTECIGLLFIDCNDPNNRLLAHLDGFTLLNTPIAKKNLLQMAEDFESLCKNKKIDIYLLGGPQFRGNYLKLKLALDEIPNTINKIRYADMEKSCQLLSKKFKTKITPMQADLTMISDAIPSPQFRKYSPKYFNGIIEKDLSKGNGLENVEDKKIYLNFFEENNKILSTHFSKANALRKVSLNSDIIKYF